MKRNHFVTIGLYATFGFLFSLLTDPSFVLAQGVSSPEVMNQDFEWENDVKEMLQEFQVCEPPVNTPCNYFLGRALKRIYNVQDFARDSGDGYLRANEIADHVKIHTDTWTFLGLAHEQSVLNEAQGYANGRKAVIAVLKRNSTGHVAIILPGNTRYSGEWQMNVPNSASFFIGRPAKSYIGKGLSYGFLPSEKSRVEIYGRNF